MTTSSAGFAAVDLGASSGRVMRGSIGSDGLELTEVHRFRNGPVAVGDRLYWDVLGLWQDILTGLRSAGEVASIGIDTWAVDYGLLDGDNALLANPRHYRDGRTAAVPESVDLEIPATELYQRNGLQRQPFTTLYQLRAESLLGPARTVLLMPDLLGFWLTGRQVAEATNASTTGLVDARTHGWDADLVRLAGLESDQLPALVEPGHVIGPVDASIGAAAGWSGAVPVVTVGSHDTASAVVGVPAAIDSFAYICCGTWGLVGVELSEPVLSEASRTANFTNERGVDGTVRYLQNVMGLWVLSECLREWQTADLTGMLTAAAGLAGGPIVNINDPSLLAPGPMQGRIQALCESTGQHLPADPVAVVRCVVASLAVAFAQAVQDASTLSGRRVDIVHLVGGGARNTLLCQLTADVSGLPVVAGPVEATAWGNVLVQARAAGAVTGSLMDLRGRLADTQHLTTYRPGGAS